MNPNESGMIDGGIILDIFPEINCYGVVTDKEFSWFRKVIMGLRVVWKQAFLSILRTGVNFVYLTEWTNRALTYLYADLV